MRILYIVPFVPWPLRPRAFNLIPRLAAKHEISLVCIAGSAEEEARAGEWASVCKQVRCVRRQWTKVRLQCLRALATPKPLRMAYHHSGQMRQAVRDAIAEFSPTVIYAERWPGLDYVPPDSGIPVLCDLMDSLVLYNQRLMRIGQWWQRLLGAEEYLKFRNYEARLARRADVVVLCSSIDLECVRQNAPEARYVVVPNGVDCDKFFMKGPSEEESATIVFTGHMNYWPNRYAVRFFLDKVFPQVRRRIPAAKFLVAGKGAQGFLRPDQVKNPNLEVVDFVPELRPYIARAAVAAAPILNGVGTTCKVVEAFSTGTPVVATHFACGDLAVRDGEHLLLAQQPEEFAEQVVRLLCDPDLRIKLANQARRLVEERYDWGIVSRSMEATMIRLVKSRSAPTQSLVSSGV